MSVSLEERTPENAPAYFHLNVKAEFLNSDKYYKAESIGQVSDIAIDDAFEIRCFLKQETPPNAKVGVPAYFDTVQSGDLPEIDFPSDRKNLRVILSDGTKKLKEVVVSPGANFATGGGTVTSQSEADGNSRPISFH